MQLPEWTVFLDWFAFALSAGLGVGVFAAFASDRR